jgi:hypothetical protein
MNTQQTRIDALLQNLELAPTQRNKVLAFFVDRQEQGATDEEVQIGLGMNPSTQRPRRLELEGLGKITGTSQTRRTRSGRQAIVFRIK